MRFGFSICLIGLLATASADASTAPVSPAQKYEQCSWLVSYRGRTYDLAPLTRETLARPIEGDIRSLLSRVPAAADHLSQVTSASRAAKVQAIIASAALGVFLGTRIARSGSKKDDESARLGLDIAAIVSGLFFAKGLHASYQATLTAREELALAVEAFNAGSPHPIQPVVKGGP